MLKHIQPAPRSRRSVSSDDGSQGSTSAGSVSSRCPSALSSIGEPSTGVVKVFCSILRPDVVSICARVSTESTTTDVVHMLLSKCKMRNRDPNLFYISMDIYMQSQSVEPLRTVLILDDYARPLDLKICQPSGYSVKFTLRSRKGGLVKIHDSCLNITSKYKSLLISQRTTVTQVIQLLLNCHNSMETAENFALFEVDHMSHYARQLSPEEMPLLAREHWPSESSCSFHLRRVPSSVTAPSQPTFLLQQLTRDALPWKSMDNLRTLFPEKKRCSSTAEEIFTQSHYQNFVYI